MAGREAATGTSAYLGDGAERATHVLLHRVELLARLPARAPLLFGRALAQAALARAQELDALLVGAHSGRAALQLGQIQVGGKVAAGCERDALLEGSDCALGLAEAEE